MDWMDYKLIVPNKDGRGREVVVVRDLDRVREYFGAGSDGERCGMTTLMAGGGGGGRRRHDRGAADTIGKSVPARGHAQVLTCLKGEFSCAILSGDDARDPPSA